MLCIVPEVADLPSGTLTFFFSDIEGSTRLLQELGPSYADLLTRHAELIRDAIARHDGVEIGTEGDSFFVVFENAPEAVAAAGEMQQALAAEEWVDGVHVRARMGLHTGQALLFGDNYGGIDVHRAARIASAGHGGQIVISDATRSLVEPSLPEGLSLRDLGSHRLKDLIAAEHLYQVDVAGLPTEHPPLKTMQSRPTNLLPPLTTFVGREREIDQISQLVGSSRLVTLTGPGGTGKTRLSLEVGTRALDMFQDGVFFVPLAPINDPTLVPSTIVKSLGLREDGARPVRDVLRDYLARKELLLVLDNFEQIVEAAPFVADLLQHAPGVKMVVTSRERLQISGEQEFPVPPLTVPDPRTADAASLGQTEAVALFAQRAASVRPGFAVTEENARTIGLIVQRVDGLPLAIELAAARVKLLSPDAILERLEKCFSILTSGSRDLPSRQRTLKGAIDWSYDLLEKDERVFFRRLGVFVGGLAIEAADAVCNPDFELALDTFDVLASLVDKSLVRQEDAEGEPRFRLLHVIREYAVERLAEEAELEEMRERHCAYFLELAETLGGQVVGRDGPSVLDRLEVEHDNLRAALRWMIDGDRADLALRLGSAIWRFWQLRGHLNEAHNWFEEIFTLPSAAERNERRQAGLTANASVAYWQYRFDDAARAYQEALDIAREIGDTAAEVDSLYNLAFMARIEGDTDRAIELFQRCRVMYREMGNEVGAAYTMWGESWMLTLSQDYEPAQVLAHQAIEIFKRAGDRFGQSLAQYAIARSSIEKGNFEGGVKAYLEALDLSRAMRDYTSMAAMLDEIGLIALERGEPKLALVLAGAADSARAVAGGGSPPALIGRPNTRQSARGTIDDEAAEKLWEEGRALPIDDAVRTAVEWLAEQKA